MHTLFSHIIQKRFSRQNEDVATEALAYVLESSEAARRGMTKLLRGLVPDLPLLRFETQQVEGTIRPDMWGFSDRGACVFIENKFWAGLTDNQPVAYLNQLASYPQPTLLLVIAPSAREHTLWRELTRRLTDANITSVQREPCAAIAHSADTISGPIIALTSWADVLSTLEHELIDDPRARNDLIQLRALCDTADEDAFHPMSGEELSDQRIPTLIMQMNSIFQLTVDLALSEKVLSTNGLRPQANGERIGQYVWMPVKGGAGSWIGIHFGLWKKHGATPLWLVFSDTAFGRLQEVKRLIEPWASRNGILTSVEGGEFSIALDILVGEEKTAVVRSLVGQLGEISEYLAELPR